MRQKQEEIKVHSKVAKLLFGSLAFVLLGIGLIYAGAESSNYFVLIIGFISMALFSLGLVFSVSKLIKSEPALLINQEGIVDKSSYAGAGAVSWNEIKNISFYQAKKEKIITIELYDPERLISRQPLWKQKLMRLNKGMAGATIHLSSLNLSCNLYELFPLLYRRWNNSKSGSDLDTQKETI
ncbi:hypothetical protein AMS62_21445 [Bacillus sp. FJAT-18019]|nr:hypothetical protein AMS62_21445 [Bacillus sp. FJAT-18019]